MSTNVFVSVTTTDLPRATAFYEALGFSVNPAFSDDKASCMVVDEHVYVMVVSREYFATMTDKTVVDPRTSALVGLSLTRDSREDVDRAVERGLAAGGTELRPAQDYGFMYSRDLDDPDGNNVGFLFMEPEAAEQGPEAYLAQHSPSA